MTSSFTAGPPVSTVEQPPKRRGRPKGSGSKPRSLEPQIAATLMAVNMAFYIAPGLRSDALDEHEISALAKALDAQAKSSVRFRKMLEGALAVTSGGQLFGVLVLIGGRRAARHGLLPQEADSAFLSMLVAGLQTTPPPGPSYTPPQAETEPTNVAEPSRNGSE